MPPRKKQVAASQVAGKRRSGAAARAKAMARMIKSYPERWEELLREEREALGLPAEVGKVSRLQKLVASMRLAGVREEEIQQALVEAGFKKAVQAVQD